MTFQEFVTKLTKAEGLKKQVDVAQMSEVVGIVADEYHKNPKEVSELLAYYGKRRAEAKAGK